MSQSPVPGFLVMRAYHRCVNKDVINLPGLEEAEYLEQCLVKAAAEADLTDEEICFLLELADEGFIELLYRAARNVRSKYFGNKVFYYGFIYYSTWCRNNCTFCGYRAANGSVERYRKTVEEVVAAAVELASSGVHLLDLTMGEDPVFYQSEESLQRIVELVRAIRKKVDLPLMISPGVGSKALLSALAKEGVEWYACYQETHNPALYSRLRLDQEFDIRMKMKRLARELGLLIEEGILTGVGETSADITHSLRAMGALNAHQVRVMSFVPQLGTPLENIPTPPRSRELKIIAVMRLLFPDRLIPASLDVDGIGGLNARIAAGANVVTSIIPARSGLMGVSNSTLEVDEGYRSVESVSGKLSEMGLEAASLADYKELLKQYKKRNRRIFEQAD
jgi:methylornithine synthase